MPPICRIFFRVIWRPKRNAIVISRIENEQGCTLSRSDETRTSGRSHAPPALALQISDEVAGLHFRMSTPRMKAAIAPPIMRILRILGRHVRPYLEFKRAAVFFSKRDQSVDPADASRPMRVRFKDDADRAALACLDELICWRHVSVAGHAERTFGRSVRTYQKGCRAHARRDYPGNHDVGACRIRHGKFFGDISFFHPYGSEIIGCLRSDKTALRRGGVGRFLNRSCRSPSSGRAPDKKPDENKQNNGNGATSV